MDNKITIVNSLTKSQIAGLVLGSALLITSFANLSALGKNSQKIKTLYEEFKNSNVDYIDYMTKEMKEANQNFVDGKINIEEVNEITERLADNETVEGCFKLYADKEAVEEVKRLDKKSSINSFIAGTSAAAASVAMGVSVGSVICQMGNVRSKTKENEIDPSDNDLEM